MKVDKLTILFVAVCITCLGFSTFYTIEAIHTDRIYRERYFAKVENTEPIDLHKFYPGKIIYGNRVPVYSFSENYFYAILQVEQENPYFKLFSLKFNNEYTNIEQKSDVLVDLNQSLGYQALIKVKGTFYTWASDNPSSSSRYRLIGINSTGSIIYNQVHPLPDYPNNDPTTTSFYTHLLDVNETDYVVWEFSYRVDGSRIAKIAIYDLITHERKNEFNVDLPQFDYAFADGDNYYFAYDFDPVIGITHYNSKKQHTSYSYYAYPKNGLKKIETSSMTKAIQIRDFLMIRPLWETKFGEDIENERYPCFIHAGRAITPRGAMYLHDPWNTDFLGFDITKLEKFRPTQTAVIFGIGTIAFIIMIVLNVKTRGNDNLGKTKIKY